MHKQIGLVLITTLKRLLSSSLFLSTNPALLNHCLSFNVSSHLDLFNYQHEAQGDFHLQQQLVKLI